MAEEEVALLSFWPSVFGQRVTIALQEKGVEYEHTEEDLFNKSPLLLQMNPVHKQIPVLLHNGKPVCESSIIVQYIDEVWKDEAPSLLPSDPFRRAQARFWADFIDKKVFEAARNIYFSKRPAEEEAKKTFVGILQTLEGELGERTYFGGDNFGYVDVCLIPFSCWFHTIETFGDFSIGAECPKLVAWAERCKRRDSVSKALPHENRVLGFTFELRKAFGVD